ncbi:MAG: peptidase [Bacteroidetes bacterium]|nr:peptidase [Bacteroidota bacterium]
MKLNFRKIKDIWKDIYPQLKHKHRLIVMDANTFVEKFSFNLTAVNLFTAIGLSAIALVLITTVIIAFTPLREYIPGYPSVKLERESYRNYQKLDSLENYVNMQENMIKNLKMVLYGEDIPTIKYDSKTSDSTKDYDKIELKRSKADSLFRLSVENEDKYQVASSQTQISNYSHLKESFFFTPIKGRIISPFNPSKKNYGVDISVNLNESIKSIANGVVIFSYLTVEDEKVIGIQHSNSFISVYKNCSSIIKSMGDYVRAGEPIAFCGKSGHGSKVPLLHFELWNSGNAVNPSDYISF